MPQRVICFGLISFRIKSMRTLLLALLLTTPLSAFAYSKSCSKNTDCPQGMVCAPVRGEFPGSCAEGLKKVNIEKKGCMKNSDCPKGKICATIKGDYPGGCADGLR